MRLKTFLLRLISAPVACMIIIFAVNNREEVVMNMWPLKLSFEIPVFALLIIGLALGVILGSIISKSSRNKK